MTDATPTAFSITSEDPAQEDVIRLLGAGEAHSASLYPPESNHHLALDALKADHVRVFVARDSAGTPVGTAALVLADGWAEIKGMWAEPTARGSGLADALLARLLTAARAEGIAVVRLETGVRSYAALNLYRGAGFVERGPFADYGPDPLSIFMEKRLNDGEPSASV